MDKAVQPRRGGFQMGGERLRRWHKRISILALGLTVNSALVVGYDWVVYPYLIATFGLLLGWLYALLGSIVLCLGSLWFYDLTQQDWLGIETLKALRDAPAAGRMRRVLHTVANRGDALAFLLLCVKYDPFITTVYMRRGRGNHTMAARDWKIFWLSVVVANLWWGLFVFGVIHLCTQWLKPLIDLPLVRGLGVV